MAGRTTPPARSAGSSRTSTTWAACPTTGSAPGCGRSSRRTACRLDTWWRPRKPTTLALVDLDADGAATYRFYTDETSAPALTPEAALAALPADVDFLHVGTLGLVMEPIASALQAVVEAVADRALIMVDPNCRPTFIADRDAYRASLAKTLRHAHVVKVSGDDLEYLSPGVGMAEAARELGVPVALVTLGGDGALIVTADGEVQVDAPKITVVDTIGAGDAFGGGFLTYWARAGLTREALAGRGGGAGGDALCVRRRRPDLRAGGCFSAEAVRPRRRPLSRGQARARAASGAPRGRSRCRR